MYMYTYDCIYAKRARERGRERESEEQLFHTNNVLHEHVVHHGIDVVVHVAEHEGKAVLDGHLQLLQEVVVVERADLDVREKSFRELEIVLILARVSLNIILGLDQKIRRE